MLNFTYYDPGIRRILYLSFNDGSDTRVCKEVRSLVKSGAKVDFLGIGRTKACCFVADLKIRHLFFVYGNRRAPFPAAAYFLRAAYLLITRRYDSVHVLNEPQLLVLWPLLLLQKRVIADLFDSVFLRLNMTGDHWALLKKIVYLPAHVILVTDENRFRLSALTVKRKTRILPNYPLAYNGERKTGNNPVLTVMYFGWLSCKRGTNAMKGLLGTGKPLKIIMAGWIADKATRTLAMHPGVEWLGVIPQEKAVEIAAVQADYILCLYAPVNANNLNASPNKVYDAIQIGKPVIINAEIQVADFVKVYKKGYVLPSYEISDFELLYENLLAYKETFDPDSVIGKELIWEKTDYILLQAHRL